MQNKPFSSVTVSNGKSGKFQLEMEMSSLQGGDYGVILKAHGLQYTITSLYLQVGEIKQRQGWILHISVIRSQMPDLLNVLIPELADRNIPFKISLNRQVHNQIMEGSLGYYQLGKAIKIYPDDEITAIDLIKSLLPLLDPFKGPFIPTDAPLGGVLYTRYGGFYPVLLSDQYGQTSQFMQDGTGKLSKDEYHIPFQLPEGVSWPFAVITPLTSPSVPRLLNRSYLAYQLIKSDVKGKVVRGINIKRLFHWDWCLIKEGKKWMFMDDSGRDIRDRLLWQYELHKDLTGKVPLPKVLDYCKVNEDAYLVMEFIEGITLQEKIQALRKNQDWFYLSAETKIELLNYLLTIIKIIDQLHANGYVHRDITPVNFLVGKKGNLFLIDLELSYSLSQKRPDPPFMSGTPGFMSPEQRLAQTPAIQEDIYGVGATMVVLFTGQSPLKFSNLTREELTDNLNFFIQDPEVTNLVTGCFHYQPDSRPSLRKIYREIENYQKKISDQKRVSIAAGSSAISSINDQKAVLVNDPSVISIKHPSVVKETKSVSELLTESLQCLSGQQLVTPGRLWDSKTVRGNKMVNNESHERSLYMGMQEGMAGVTYLLAVAKKLGYPINNCKPIYRNSWKYIEDNFFARFPAVPAGLMRGSAGIAISLAAGIEAGLLPSKTQQRNTIKQCLTVPTAGIDFAAGITGQGIAVLRCAAYLESSFINDQLQKQVGFLLEEQRKDGSWIMPPDGKRIENFKGWQAGKKQQGKKVTGFMYGIAGITSFLLKYYSLYKDGQVLTAAERALKWLETNAHSTGETLYWNVYPGIREVDPWAANGVAGITLPFLHAYELSGDKTFKEVAEKTLRFFPEHINSDDFTQSTGLSGLGEIYLDAFRILQSEEWLTRAQWISGLFTHCYKRSNYGGVYWQENNFQNLPAADLLTGNGGIIHFLMRMQKPDQLTQSLLLFS